MPDPLHPKPESTDDSPVKPEVSAPRLESSPNGRAKCRGCGQNIAKGEQRFGESVVSPFTGSETTLWFHADCAACRRPEAAIALFESESAADPTLKPLLDEASLGVQHPRLARVALIERSPSGRAKCRQCQELIGKDLLRIKLEIFEEARFQPIGYIHLTCQREYFGAPPSLERLKRCVQQLSALDLAEVAAACEGSE